MIRYRQGDVGLAPLDSQDIPQDLDFKPTQHVVLAEGEQTGHAHTITLDAPGEEIDGGEFPMQMATKDGVMYLRIAEPLPLKHQEHATIVVEPGTYKVQRQREYSPEEIRTVAD